MRNIIFGMLVIAASAFIVNCGGDPCADLGDELKDLVCADAPDGCGADSAACKAFDATADDDDAADAECTDAAETVAQDAVDNFSTDTYCPSADDDDAAADDDDATD